MDESALTGMERRLLPLLTTTLSLNDIAQALGISHDEVIALTQSIYSKLGVPENPPSAEH